MAHDIAQDLPSGPTWFHQEMAVKAFSDAVAEMEKKSKELDAVVGPKLNALKEAEDIPGLMDLADSLPNEYRGKRRIYQAALEIEHRNHVCVIGEADSANIAVCKICGKDHGWYCPDSPDHTCYYCVYKDDDGVSYVFLRNGEKFRFDKQRDWSGGGYACAFCGEPEERK